jgi:hypothetical protein
MLVILEELSLRKNKVMLLVNLLLKQYPEIKNLVKLMKLQGLLNMEEELILLEILKKIQ